MAKRDKLYTVNKWNKPFFEEKKRKKLYPGGGLLSENTNGFRPFVNENQGLTRTGLGFVPEGTGWNHTMPWYTTQGDQVNTFDKYTNPYQEMAKTHAADAQNTAGGTVNIDSLPKTTSVSDKSYKNSPSWATEIAGSFTAALPSILGSTGKAATISAASTPLGEISTYRNAIEAGAKGATKAAGKGVINAIDEVGGAVESPSAFTKIGDFFKTKAETGLALTAADLLAENTIDRWTTNPHLANSGWTTAGKIVGDIGAGVGSALISTGVGAGPGFLAWGIGKGLEQILKGAATSIENKDQIKNYINWANNLNINGSNEQIANMLAQYGGGAPMKAQGHAGWVAKLFGTDVYKDAKELNNQAANVTEGIYRKARHAFNNNNDIAYMHALNDYYSAAMGGRLNRKKCNCKATGGFLNNAILDSASATGYNFLSDLTNMQMQNNQNKQDMGSSLGNSFTGLSNGTLFANGGGIHINPAHKGEFTAKAKRHGMGVQQFASHVLAHKDKFPTSTIRQAVFAKNSNTWKKAFGGKLNYGKDKDIRDSGFFDGQTLYAIGGPLQAMSSNWSPGRNVTEINAGGQHETNPYQGVQVGVDPEGTPNLVEENEVIWNDYVFSNRLKVPKEVCKELRVGQKKDGFTFAEVARKLLAESKERPNDPISKKGLDANMQKLEDAQEELKQKMEAEEAVEQFNSLPPEQQVAIMQQEGERAQDAVAQEQMAQEMQNLPPEQQQAIAQQMAMQQAQQQGVPQGMSPEEQYAMQQQAMQDQAAQEQYAQQRDARNQEVLAQAAAMQDQAINSSAMGGKLCFGGKMFAEGGELDNTQPQAESGATQQDTEMAKYSDEELQDMIDDYQEAESGEVKVTKGKLARLKKKAEKAQAELERRHTEENAEQPQEARQEPTQEELQAAAMAQAQEAQQPIEGQSQEGMPQEGMSPEQAMMMQQQMAGQMGQGSPEEMAAMEQQGQYGYGGRLYLTGGQLLNMFGFPTISAAEKAGWNPEDFGITSWFDTIDDSVVNDFISNGTARWLDPKFVNENTIPDENYRLAFNNYNYNPFSPVKTPGSYTWYEPGDGDPAAYSRPHFTNNGSWQEFYGENPTRSTIVNESVYKALTDAYKSLNGLKFRDDLTLGELDNYMKNSADWKARQDWLWTHQDAAKHRLKYLADIARNNEDDKGKLKGADKFSAQNIYDFEKLNDGTYKVSLKQGKNANDERTWWDAVTSDLKYGDMYNAPHIPDTRNVYIDRDTGEVLTAEPGKDSGYTLVGNPLSSYVAATTDNSNDYNQTIRFYTKKANGNNSNSNGKNPDFSELEPIRNDTGVDWSGLGFAAAGPLMGLGLQYAFKPDTRSLDEAVAAYERNTGTMVAPHLTHGLIRPTIIDPRVVRNSMNQSRLGTNRLLMNTGASPSRGATILTNDANSINQLGQAMIENWKANRAQEQAAAGFNRETATTNANILNQVDQFNAQTQASLANTAAQMRYNAAKEALDQNNAWKAGLIQNIGGLGKGIYDYWRDQQNIKQRDMLAELLFPMNDDWARQHHISYVDPVTGLVRRGENKGKHYFETADGKRQYLPYATINGINGETGITLSLGKKKSNGGKLKKKRKGYTF